MAHYDIFRDRLGIKYPAFGHALWEPSPGELYPPVEVGDVGFIREGKFHRLFNALLDAGHPSQTFGVPEYHEPLLPNLANHIDNGTLSPTDFCSYGVTVAGGVDVFAREPVGAADVSFLCSRTCGAVLSLPVKAQRKDTIARGDFGKWIIRNIDSWFAFTRRLGLGIGQMEDIVLVTGHHRTRSWTNIAFFENSRVTLGVQVTGDGGASVDWKVSREHIQGAMLSEGPSGEDLPEDQCIFVRGFRVVRAFKLFPRLKGAAGHTQDPGEHGSEPGLEVVSIPSFPKYKDPLHVFLEYISKRAPDCDLALVHDDDLDRLCRTGGGTSLETLQPVAVVDHLQRSEPEIAQAACDSSSENDSLRTNTRGSMVALFSEEFNSWGGEFCISQQRDRLSTDATTPVPVSPPIRPRPVVQTPASIPVATQAAALQPRSQPAPHIPVYSFLSLSTELIIKIASCLRAQDIAVLRLCCRRMHLIIEGSPLLQYLYRMEQAGVVDPLWDLPGRPIIDRLEALERWEASWNDIGRYLVTPRLVIPAERDLFGPFFLCDEYLLAVDWQGHPTGLRQPALLYVDLRDALRTGQHRWKQIDYPPGSIAITQAFSIEEDDLVVSVLSLPRVDSAPTSTVLRFMSLETGGAHPLAKLPNLRLDTQLPVSLLDVRADVIGDQIVLVLVDLRNDTPESDAIYLVDWKQGLMSLVHRAPNGTYEGALSVLSPELVLFLKRELPSIELCRVTRGTAQTPPSLRVVRTLALPQFHVGYHVHTVYMQTDRHSARQRGTPLQRPPSPLPFHSAPDDMVVGITFLLRQHGPQTIWKKVVTTISHRALFALAAVDGDDDGDGEQESAGGDDTVPWEEWGPSAARVIAPSSFQWITAHAGQRWLSLEADRLVIRDFSAVRVRRAAAAARDGACDRGVGTVSELPPAQTVIHGGSTCFAHDVTSALPFVETRVEAPTQEHSMVLTDGERLVAFVRVGQPPTFDIHVLEENDVSSSSAGPRSSHSQSRAAALGGEPDWSKPDRQTNSSIERSL